MRSPPPPPLLVRPARPPRRFRRGKDWRRYGPDVLARARALVEGTTWAEAAIAARLGVGVATVHGWKLRHGWRRPRDASISTRKVAVSRAGFTRRCREVLRAVERLATLEAKRLADAPEPDPASVTRATVLVVRAQRALRDPRKGGARRA